MPSRIAGTLKFKTNPSVKPDYLGGASHRKEIRKIPSAVNVSERLRRERAAEAHGLGAKALAHAVDGTDQLGALLIGFPVGSEQL